MHRYLVRCGGNNALVMVANLLDLCIHWTYRVYQINVVVKAGYCQSIYSAVVLCYIIDDIALFCPYFMWSYQTQPVSVSIFY